MSRRTLLLAAAATTMAACSSSRSLGGDTNVSQPTSDTGGSGDVDLVAGSTPNPPAANVPGSVVMIGDSITALSKLVLEPVLQNIGFDNVTVNAEPKRRIEVGKKPMPGLAVVKFVAATAPPDMWVIALGTNDAGQYATEDEYRQLVVDVLGEIDDDAPVVWVNTYRDDQLPGCVQFNDSLRATLKQRGNASVADWYDRCSNTTTKILTNDGVHPNKAGILVFADTVRTAIAAQLS